MSAGDLVLVIAAVLCTLGFAALIVVLVRVLDMIAALREEVSSLRSETQPMEDARDDLARFDRVLGSAEAISEAVSGGGRVARVALSTPVIKTAALATGTSRAVHRLRRGNERRSA